PLPNRIVTTAAGFQRQCPHASAGATGDDKFDARRAISALTARDPLNQARILTLAPRTFLEELFRTAVAAAHPANCLPAHLPPPPPSGRLIILAAGKAAGSMAAVAERCYLDERAVAARRIAGLAVTRHGYGTPTRLVRVVEAGHPVPDTAGLAATQD